MIVSNNNIELHTQNLKSEIKELEVLIDLLAFKSRDLSVINPWQLPAVRTPLAVGRDVPDQRWSRVWDCYLCCIDAGHRMSHSLYCHERLSHNFIPAGILHSYSKK